MDERGVALQERINRIAADLSVSTGKPLRFWLEETARMIAGTRRWTITEGEHGTRLVVVDDDVTERHRSSPSSGAPDASSK